MAYEPLIQQCVMRPSFALMRRAYDDYRRDSAPCKGGVTNQCAVRMSIALERCGHGLESFQPRNRVHAGRATCQVTVPHVLGASELANHLRRTLGAPEVFGGRAAATAARTLRGRQGIVYFNNCFSREPGAPPRGDHIDLWTGDQYYNEIIHVGAGGNAGVGAPLFGRADAVWFFPLRA